MTKKCVKLLKSIFLDKDETSLDSYQVNYVTLYFMPLTWAFL